MGWGTAPPHLLGGVLRSTTPPGGWACCPTTISSITSNTTNSTTSSTANRACPDPLPHTCGVGQALRGLGVDLGQVSLPELDHLRVFWGGSRVQGSLGANRLGAGRGWGGVPMRVGTVCVSVLRGLCWVCLLQRSHTPIKQQLTQTSSPARLGPWRGHTPAGWNKATSQTQPPLPPSLHATRTQATPTSRRTANPLRGKPTQPADKHNTVTQHSRLGPWRGHRSARRRRPRAGGRRRRGGRCMRRGPPAGSGR